MNNMKAVKEFIIENGGQIIECPFGKSLVRFYDKDITGMGYKVFIKFKGLSLVDKSFVGAVHRLEQKGLIDMLALGYSACPKCNGCGKTHHTFDNGRCFRCNGTGYVPAV